MSHAGWDVDNPSQNADGSNVCLNIMDHRVGDGMHELVRGCRWTTFHPSGDRLICVWINHIKSTVGVCHAVYLKYSANSLDLLLLSPRTKGFTAPRACNLPHVQP